MKTVKYPIPHDEEGGTLFLLGDSASPRVLLMCPGFPDDQSAFLSLAERLSEKNCLVGVTCLPGYDKIGYKDGYSFQDWVYCMQEASKALRAKSTAKTPAKFTGVYHDWGSLAGQMFTTNAIKNDSMVPDEIILFDVCLSPHPETDKSSLKTEASILTSIYTFAVILAYQLLLAKCFLLQRYISKHLAVLVYTLGFKVLGLLHLTPICKVDHGHAEKVLQTTPLPQVMYMAYPYYNMWKALITNPKELHGAYLPLDLKKTPVLFMYGKDKNINFHEPAVSALLEQEEALGNRSKIVEVANAGHWLYIQQEDICVQEIAKFLDL